MTDKPMSELIATARIQQTIRKFTGADPTARMKRYGVTGLVLLGEKAIIETADGAETVDIWIGLWFAERLYERKPDGKTTEGN